jgi:hypothetical protein
MARWACAALALEACSGCGSRPALYPINGVVTRAGQPLPDVMVSFVPEGPMEGTGVRFSGVTDARGRYALRGADQEAGATPGWHRILIEDLEPCAIPRGEQPPPTPDAIPKSRVPDAYRSLHATPLRREVLPGPQTLDLAVEPTSRP